MKPPCKIANCGQPVKGHGYCTKHLQRWRNHGDPNKVLGTPAGAAKEALDRIANYTGDECVIWPFYRNDAGYGVIGTTENKTALVPRVICTIVRGPPPTPKHETAHSCGNGHLGCGTPKHLRWATRLENSKDRISHGRAAKKLTPDQARSIFTRAIAGEDAELIAGDFSIKATTVIQIKRGHIWSWATGVAQKPYRRSENAPRPDVSK